VVITNFFDIFQSKAKSSELSWIPGGTETNFHRRDAPSCILGPGATRVKARLIDIVELQGNEPSRRA